MSVDTSREIKNIGIANWTLAGVFMTALAANPILEYISDNKKPRSEHNDLIERSIREGVEEIIQEMRADRQLSFE